MTEHIPTHAAAAAAILAAAEVATNPVPLVQATTIVDPAQMEAAARRLLETAQANRQALAEGRPPRDVAGQIYWYVRTAELPDAAQAYRSATGQTWTRDGDGWVMTEDNGAEVEPDEHGAPPWVMDLEELDEDDFPLHRIR